MNSTATSAFGPGPEELRGLNRAVRWSVAAHVAVVILAMAVPQDWLGAARPKPNLITISLGGTPGPKSTGTQAIGGRAVEQAVPQPARPEPVRPAPPQRTVAAPVPAPPRPAQLPRPTEMARPTQIPARLPTTGAQVTPGSSAVDTGARGQGVGLSFGGGGSGGETDLGTFCCPEYLQILLGTIEANWQKAQQERGTTTLKFAIRRDGAIVNVEVEQTSGSGLLDRAARTALQRSKLPPLPREFTKEMLTVHLKFPYGT